MNCKKTSRTLTVAVLALAALACTKFDRHLIRLPHHVLQEKDRFLGKTIALRGMVRIINRQCTRKACEKTECCNRCNSEVGLWYPARRTVIIRSGPGRASGTGKVGCQGTECYMQCLPLELGKTYEVVGTWLKDRHQNYYLALSHYRLFRT